jgi:hypothetical protein
MFTHSRLGRRVAQLAPLCGLAVVGGCMGYVERSVDLVLSPAASDNIGVVPFTALAGLAMFFAQYVLR